MSRDEQGSVVVDTVLYPVDSVVEGVYTRLSVCVCGYRTLCDEVPLGTKYKLLLNDQLLAGYKCGGCGKVTRNLRIVYAIRETFGGYVPLILFEYPKN